MIESRGTPIASKRKYILDQVTFFFRLLILLGFAYWDPMTTKIIEIVLIVVINFFFQLRGYYRQKTKEARILEKILVTLSLLSLLEITISLIIPEIYPFTWIATLSRIIFLYVLVK